ncbi:unnamed protein product [Symbiodinium sp. CCMP2592]|nr:unnamed protein product [Symbiodinium sp. CCMP2592]
MKQSTVEGRLGSLEIIRAPESLSALADADADAPSLRPMSDSQTVQSLLEGEPSMMVQIGKAKGSVGQAGQGSTPSRAGEVTEERSGTGRGNVDQIEDDENDGPVDDEYELLCNESEDAVARSDAALADCSKDEERTVERTQVASVGEQHCEPLAQHSRSDKIIDQVVNHLRETHGESVVLTHEELEEEAVLLLIRQFNQGASYDEVIDDLARKFVAEQSESEAVPGSIRNPQANSQASQASRSGNPPGRVAFVFDDSDVCTSAASASSVASGELGSTDEGEANGGTAQDRLPRFVAKWHAEFRRTAEALAYRADRNELPLGHNDEVSLLLSLQSREECDGFQLFFVKWVDAATRTGRSVRIDKNFRVVYSPPVLFGKQDASMEVTWQEAKTKKQKKCIVCGQVGAAGSKKSSGSMAPPTEIPKQCSFCLLFWHSRCADGITEELRDNIRTGETFADIVQMSAVLVRLLPTLPDFVTSMLLNDPEVHDRSRHAFGCYCS